MTNEMRRITMVYLAGVFVAASLALSVALPGAPVGPSDEWLDAQLTTTYARNPHLKSCQLRVDVRAGIATLRGTVRNAAQRSRAVKIAQGMDGIRKVNDQIRVRRTTAAEDASRGPAEPRAQWALTLRNRPG